MAMSQFLFSTEDRKLHNNFMDSQFEDPAIYARELVANALDSGTDRVDIQIFQDLFVIEDYGQGMTESDIENYFLELHSSKTRDREGKIGEHGIGVHSIFSQDPYLVEVETARNGSNVRFQITSDLELNVVEPGVKTQGTKISIYKSRSAFYERKLSEVEGSPEEKVIRAYCRYHPTTIIINGRKINEPISVKGQPRREIIKDNLQGSMAMIDTRPQTWWEKIKNWFRDTTFSSTISVLNNGVLLEKIEDNYVRGVVNSDRISPVLSRNQAKRDARFENFKQSLQLEKLKLIKDRYNSDQLRKRTEIHEFLLQLLRQRNIRRVDLQQPGRLSELDRYLIAMPLFGSSTGYSLLDLHEEWTTNQKLVYTRFHIRLRNDETRFIIQSLNSEEVNLLKQIFPPSSIINLTETKGSEITVEEQEESLLIPEKFRLNSWNKLSETFFSGVLRGWGNVFQSGGNINNHPGNFTDFIIRRSGLLRLTEFTRNVVNSLGRQYRRSRAIIQSTRDNLQQKIRSTGHHAGTQIRKTWGQLRTKSRLVPKAEYTSEQQHVLSQLQQLTEKSLDSRGVKVRKLRLVSCRDSSRLALRGEAFGRPHSLFLNIRHPLVKRALATGENQVLRRLVPVIVSEGVQEVLPIHEYSRRGQRTESAVDSLVEDYLDA